MKFRCDDLEAVKEKLLSNSFELDKIKHQIDTYFIVNETQKDGTRDYLRVREDKKKNFISLDYHKVLSLLETDETEVDVMDKDKIVKIIELLGRNVQCAVDKQREQYKNNEIIVTLDLVKDLGSFVEIEINADLTPENEKKLMDTMDLLGLNESQRVKKQGYPDLLLASQKE